MTPATDDSALEAAFEALLAGRGAPPAAGGLAAFTDGVRATAARPPRPNAALAELLATGLLTDQSSVPAPRAARRPRRSTRMFLAFFAKIAAAGVAAKTAVVGGVVVVGLSTAGFTGALPDPLQHDFATVVDTATPLTAPDPEATTTPATDDSTTGDSTTDPSGTGTATATPTDGSSTGATDGGASTGTTATTVPAQPTTGNGLGSQVAGKVEHGSVDGTRVSDLAHQRNEDRKGASTAPSGPSASDDDESDDRESDDHEGDDQGTATTGGTGTSGGSSSVSSSGHEGSGHGGHGHGDD